MNPDSPGIWTPDSPGIWTLRVKVDTKEERLWCRVIAYTHEQACDLASKHLAYLGFTGIVPSVFDLWIPDTSIPQVLEIYWP